ELTAAFVERELPFMICIRAAGQDCFIRGRMDAAVAGDPPRDIDYKYAVWKEGREPNYEVQMTAYALALMKSAGVERAIADLWYLKSPMKVVRRECTLAEAERALSNLFERYLVSLRADEWPMAERSYCDSVECGFRAQCWGL